MSESTSGPFSLEQMAHVMGGANKNMAERVLIKRQCWTFYPNPHSIHVGLMTMRFACERLGVRFFFTVCVSVYKKREALSAHQSCSSIHGSPHFLLFSHTDSIPAGASANGFFSNHKKASIIIMQLQNFAERNHCYELVKFLFITPLKLVLVRGRHTLIKPTYPLLLLNSNTPTRISIILSLYINE